MSNLVPSQVAEYPMSQRRKAYDRMVDQGWQDSLDSRISARVPLTEKEIEAAMDVIAHRAWQKTKHRVRGALCNVPNIPSYGIYTRVLFHREGQLCSYCAGQDYTSEIKTVRDCLLGKV